MSAAVEPWPKRAKFFRPHLTLTVAVPPEQALDDLAAALGEERFKTKTRDATSLLTKSVNWVGLVIQLDMEWTTIEAVVVDGTGPTTLAVTGDFFNHDNGRKKAAQALSSVVEHWRSLGLEVAVTPWELTTKDERKEQERENKRRWGK